jgi:hypothetical protein
VGQISCWCDRPRSEASRGRTGGGDPDLVPIPLLAQASRGPDEPREPTYEDDGEDKDADCAVHTYTCDISLWIASPAISSEDGKQFRLFAPKPNG